MQLINIYCGLDTNGHNIDAHKLVLDLAAKYFPNGHTVIDANGRWTGEVGVINEPTLVVQVLGSTNDSELAVMRKAVQSFAGSYKQQAYQESVLITSQEIDAWFVWFTLWFLSCSVLSWPWKRAS